MAKIKFDLSGSDPEEALKSGTLESPKPGIYRCKVTEINPGHSKNKDGTPDKSRPRVEVIFEVTEGRYKGSKLWYYLTFGEGFPTMKYDQFLQVFGIASKTKRSGEWDSNKVLNKLCLVRVSADTNQSGEYRGKPTAVLKDDGRDIEDPAGGEVFGASGGGDDDWDGGDAFEGEEGAADEFGDDGFDAEARKAELTGMTAADLKPIAKALSIGLSGKRKEQVVEEIVAAESAAAEAGGAEEMLDDDEPLDDGDAVEVSEESLKAMDNDELKALAAQVGIDIKGKRKSEVISMILAAAEDGDEEPF